MLSNKSSIQYVLASFDGLYSGIPVVFINNKYNNYKILL